MVCWKECKAMHRIAKYGLEVGRLTCERAGANRSIRMGACMEGCEWSPLLFDRSTFAKPGTKVQMTWVETSYI